MFSSSRTLALTLLAASSGLVACSSGSAPSGSPIVAGSEPSNLVLPVASNPINNTSTTPGLTIEKAAVEDLVDPVTNGDIPDALQLTLRDDTATTMTGFEVYYTMKDITTGATEGYYSYLDGFTLTPNSSGVVLFDGGSGPGHYPENAYSLYRTSPNEVVFSIEVSATGFKPATATATKSVGTGEKPGE